MHTRFALFVLATLLSQDAPIDTPDKSEAAKLVEAIARKPDIYMQNCSGLQRDSTFTVIVSAAGRSSYSEHQVSAAQFASLRKVRADAVKALTAWLDAAVAGKAKADPKDDWNHPTRTKLCMLADLNAVEALPLLKKLAEKTKKAYDDASPEDKVDWGKVEKMDEGKKKALYAKWQAGADLGDTLSTIVTILRQEKFAPLLASGLEKDMQAKLAETMKKEWYVSFAARIAKNPDVDEDLRDEVIRDAVSGKAIAFWAYPTLAVNAETITQILGWVDEYGKLPAEKRLGAKGMSAWPVNR